MKSSNVEIRKYRLQRPSLQKSDTQFLRAFPFSWDRRRDLHTQSQNSSFIYLPSLWPEVKIGLRHFCTIIEVKLHAKNQVRKKCCRRTSKIHNQLSYDKTVTTRGFTVDGCRASLHRTFTLCVGPKRKFSILDISFIPTIADIIFRIFCVVDKKT